MMNRRSLLAGMTAGAAALALPPAAAAAPRARLWDRWLAHDPAATASIDHSAWDGLLQRHVHDSPDGINRVDYRGLAGADRAALDSYVAALAATPISRYGRDEQQAFWTNLYNAVTVQVILDHAPVDSIRDIDISPGLFADGPWGKALVTVEGEPLSLDDIEHRILRPIWRDPRVHYAVNCAALGCPNLQRRAFTAANSESLLETGATAYVNHPRGAQVAAGRLTVSSIYVWFQEDFGGSDIGVIGHLRRYAANDLAARLAGISRIADDRYDWRLNDWADPSRA